MERPPGIPFVMPAATLPWPRGREVQESCRLGQKQGLGMGAMDRDRAKDPG